MGDNSPKRRNQMRAESWNYNHDGSYFVTTVTQNRSLLFGDVKDGTINLNPAGEEIARYWLALESKFPQIELDEFVIMPNHLHGIIRIYPKNMLEYFEDTLGDMMRWFKTQSTNAYIRGVKQHGWPRFDGKLWQPQFYDHIIRNDHDLERIREYISENPWEWQQDPDNIESDEAWHQSQESIFGLNDSERRNGA